MTRSPVISVELLLDAETEAAVRAEWAALASAGLSSLAAHTSASNRPHITLLVRTELAALDAIAARPTFDVRLGAPLLFGAGDRRVLARSVVPSEELLALHHAVHDAAGPGADAPHTAPRSWTPHVTLARRVRIRDLEHALEVVGGDLHGTARALRRWDAATRTVTSLGQFL
ncbi:2'-5' RNA ligase family protein [Microbacterium sp. JZ31]|uniref:2'-5' RNA ligase family protein n=1 Tax=Microbacterium sp. JZ31 TaxID=1906274 RepID=UPI001EE4B060|nr:2'-5' RNA ligase family protein [Microbacterium sp. JZ31]